MQIANQNQFLLEHFEGGFIEELRYLICCIACHIKNRPFPLSYFTGNILRHTPVISEIGCPEVQYDNASQIRIYGNSDTRVSQIDA